MPEEVPLGEDCKDWAANLDDSERNLLTQIFRFFTQSDHRGERQLHGALRAGVQTDRGQDDALGVLQYHGDHPHHAAYALLLETIGMPESEFEAFLEYEAMRDKHDATPMGRRSASRPTPTSPAPWPCSSAFTEGLQLFASFAMLMNFPRFNKMKGMGQIISWSIRDESLHCEGMIKLYHAFKKETGCVTKAVADDIVDCCKTVVGMEDQLHRPGLRDGAGRRRA